MPEEDADAGVAVARAFSDWLGGCRAELLALVLAAPPTSTGVDFSLAGWPDLECGVTSQGLDVAAVKDGECWELLLSLDVAPVQRGPEWACAICEAEGRTQIFETRAELWRDHLFEPFERWTSEKLAPATRIEFGRAGQGSTWARPT